MPQRDTGPLGLRRGIVVRLPPGQHAPIANDATALKMSWMTADEFSKIDELLNAYGWRYNVSAERFETAPRPDGDWYYVDWEDVLAALPQLSLSDLQSYEQAKQGR
jgi:hypothetical protein